MPLRLTLLILAIISLITVGGGGFFVTSQLTATAWNVALSHTNKTTEMIQKEISFYLSHNQMSSSALAKIPQISNFFEPSNKTSVTELNSLVRDYCMAQEASLCYLMDSSGNTVVSSNYDSPNSLIGINYSFRPYFKEAIQGKPMVYLALGVTTKKRGFYFSSPVINGGKITGVVVVKYPVEKLESEFLNLAGTFTMIDPSGMVFASNQKDWLFRSLSELSTEDAQTIVQSRQFGEVKPSSVGLIETSDGLLVAADGTNYLFGKKALHSPSGWHINYLFDTANVSSALDQGVAGIPVRVLFAGLFLTIGLIVIFLYNRATREILIRRNFENSLRQSEEKYRLLFEKSEDPMWLLVDHVFVMANQAAALTLGYQSVEELVNIHPANISPVNQPDGDSSTDKADKMMEIAYKKGYHRFEWEHKRKNGEFFPVEVSLTSIPFKEHNALYCVWRDISESKNIQHALEKSKYQAESANLAKSEFLSTMSHEIRTPMTGVIGFADLLLDDNLAEESRDKVLRIKSATHSLLRLINDILDMSKLEAGKMDIEYIDFRLIELLQDVITLFEKSRQSDSLIKLQLNFSDNFPHAINSDPTRIRQILVNLIGNAFKFTHQGSVIVNSELITDSSQKQMIKISVEDSGIGMSPNTVGKLFSQFTQADASISRKYEGSGLGLAISKRLARLLGGEISVESEQGVGSKFCLYFPHIATKSDVAPNNNKSASTKFKALRQLKILLAEDNRVNQIIIQKFMESYGHTVTVVETGAEAVSNYNNNEYDLILMDVRMPEMNGPEATRLIRKLPGIKANIPIIAVTADAMKEHAKEYLEAGMNLWIAKPINRVELVQAINQVLAEEIHVPE